MAQSLPAACSDAITAADRDGAICFWNPGAERIFGRPRDDAAGRSRDLIVPEGLRQRHWDGYRATVATGRSRHGDGAILSVAAALRQNGTTISADFTVVPGRDESGTMIGLATIMRDASERFEETRTPRRRLAEATMSPESPAAR